MPKTHQICTFVVRGVYPFPLDMLRYDSCWPADGDSVSNIGRSLEQYNMNERIVPPGGFEVKLHRAQEFSFPVTQPTFARWKSFGWVVVRVESEGKWFDTSQVERRAWILP